MRRPNFFIVGAARCGTTSLYEYLWQHPEVHVSLHKEPHFFGRDLTRLAGAIRDEALYLELFADAGDRPRVGEASVWYLLSKQAAREIHAFAPDAKILVLLREPVQMAYSLYALYSRSGNEDLPTFEAALAAEPERRQGRALAPGTYFPEGLIYTDVVRHAAKLERYFDVFGRDNVEVILFDDLVGDTPGAYRRALEFLGIDPSFQAEFDRKKAGQIARMAGIRRLRRLSPEVRSYMQTEYFKLHAAPSPPLEPETAASLRELFAEDVAHLGALLGRDLSAWTRGAERPAALQTATAG